MRISTRCSSSSPLQAFGRCRFPNSDRSTNREWPARCEEPYMYEEPYKWVEAVGNRRQYLDEQFRQGSPVVAVAYETGILLLTVSKGTPKVYEIYDRLALGGMGHPADL